jgi:rhomboid-like protein
MYYLQQLSKLVSCFATGAVASLGKEQFLGLYMSAGVISSMSSYFHKTLTKKHGFSLGAVSCAKLL